MKILLALVIIILLVFIFWKNTENLESPQSAIYLYESFGFKDLAYTLSLKPGDYIKQIIRVNLKSMKISLTKLGNKYDEIRRIEIWAMNNEDVTASMESGFYNSYLEPEVELKSNPAKYKKIATVLPGQNISIEMQFPVKKILLIANA